MSPTFFHLRRAVPGLLAILLAGTGARPLRAADPGGLFPWEDKTWRQAANLLVDDALTQLPPARSAHSAAERRDLDHTRALLLLNVQPKTQSNVSEARGLLESVRQTGADDELGVSALYNLARIAQFHADPPDSARAAALYAELIARAPAHPLAQEAVSRLAALRLFEDVSPEERRARLANFETAADRLSSAPARRDLHYVLAEVCLLFTGDKEAVLRHLLAFEEAGIVRQQLAGDTMARIAVLARELGHWEIAIAHYHSFLASFQHDDRAWLLAEQLRTLEAATPPPASGGTSSPSATPPPP